MPTPREFLDALWYGSTGVALMKVFEDPGDSKTAFEVQRFAKDLFFEWPSEADGLIKTLEAPGGLAYIGAGLRSERSTAKDKVSVVSAFWATINLTDVSFDRAVGALKKFPAKPSAGILLGDVLHAFWFLKEPLGVADSDLVWTANRTIFPKLFLSGLNAHYDLFLCRAGLQLDHYDFHGLLRAPGQPGARFVAWRPEARYTIDEFTDLICPPKPAPPPSVAAPAAQPAIPQLPAAFNPSEDQKVEIEKLLGGHWLEGGPMAVHAAGMFAKSGVPLDVAREMISEAVKKANGDVEQRLKEVESTYTEFLGGKDISGGPALEKLVGGQGPPDGREKAKKAVEKIRKMLPKPPEPPKPAEVVKNGNGEEDPEQDFEIIRFVKFDSRPARWSLGLLLSSGTEIDVTVETQTFHMFKSFRSAVQEQTHFVLGFISQKRWWEMIGEARSTIEVKETPPEARPEGAIENALEEFMEDAKEKPDVGLLRSFAGYDEESQFFRFAAFKDFMKESGLRHEDRVVFEHLKKLGYKNTVKRFGPTKLQRLWMRTYEGNGNGNGHGVAPVQEAPKAAEPSAPEAPDLFGDSE